MKRILYPAVLISIIAVLITVWQLTRPYSVSDTFQAYMYDSETWDKGSYTSIELDLQVRRNLWFRKKIEGLVHIDNRIFEVSGGRDGNRIIVSSMKYNPLNNRLETLLQLDINENYDALSGFVSDEKSTDLLQLAAPVESLDQLEAVILKSLNRN